MIWHIVGGITMATELGLGCYVTHRLIDAGRRPWTWQRKLPVPKAIEFDFGDPNHDPIGLV